MANPQDYKIILVDHTEVDADGYGSFLKVICPDGNSYRVPEKRSSLWDTFKNANKYEPILTTFETYKGTQYITGAEPIKDKILKRAAYNLAIKVFDIQVEERNRSQSLAYAKDLVCAGKVPPTKLFKQAQKHYEFIKAGTIIS